MSYCASNDAKRYNILLSPGDSASHVVRDEVLTFQPGETSRTVPITLIDDDIVGESIEVFNVRLTAVPGQSVATAVQDGLAQVIVSDDDEGAWIMSTKHVY